MKNKHEKLGIRDDLVQSLGDGKDYLLFLLSIDKLSEINKFYGEKKGDMILDIAAKRLLKEFAGYEIYMVNGAKFAIKCDFIEDSFIDDMKKLVDFLYVLHDNEDMDINKGSFHMTAGISYGKDVLSSGEEALKQVKKESKMVGITEQNKCLVTYEKECAYNKNIKNAIKNGNLIPFFQPIKDIKTGTITKYECLARLKQDGKVISPFFFIEKAKEMRLYDRITMDMIDKSIMKFKDTNLRFSINFSPEDLMNEATKSHFIEQILKHEVANRVTMELLEEGNFSKQETIKFLAECKKLGVKIAIDDFGSGCANYARVKELEADYVKIDGTLIKDIQTRSTYIMIEGMVKYAREQGAKTVAEFVSSKEIYDLCVKVGIDLLQGYYIGEPHPDLVN